MDGSHGEVTEDWLLPGHARPPLIGELERRVDEAIATARASEEAVMTVGASALDAAEQARRAAELAERASAAALDAQGKVALLVQGPPAPPADERDESLNDFSERADRLVARLRQLQRVPLAGSAASDAAGQPQYAS
jgi:hypothetical protein